MSTQTAFKIEHVQLQPQAGLGLRATVPMDQLPGSDPAGWRTLVIQPYE